MPKAFPSRRRRALFALFSMALSTAVSLPVLEGAVRVLERRGPPRRPAPRLGMLRENPAGTGSYRLQPHLDLEVEIQGARIPVRINSQGMRWREVPVVKPAGRRRVAFLGDSFTFGCWAPVEDTFVGVFDQGLSPAGYEGLNFGVGGYGLDDQELILREEVARFRPDYVVATVFTGNDLRDTWLGLHKYTLQEGTVELDPANFARKAPGYTREDEPFSLAAAPDPWALRRSLTRLRSFRLLFDGLHLGNPWLHYRPSRYFTSFSYWSQYPYPEVARRARAETLDTLGRMDAESARLGARLLVVAIPSREQVYADAEQGPFYDIRLPQVFVEAYARDHDIPYLDLLPVMRAEAKRRVAHLYLDGDIHFNVRGHRLAGQAISEWFQRVGRLAAPKPVPGDAGA